MGVRGRRVGVGGRSGCRREESGCRREKSGSLEIYTYRFASNPDHTLEKKSSILQTCINFNCVLSSILL